LILQHHKTCVCAFYDPFLWIPPRGARCLYMTSKAPSGYWLSSTSVNWSIDIYRIPCRAHRRKARKRMFRWRP